MPKIIVESVLKKFRLENLNQSCYTNCSNDFFILLSPFSFFAALGCCLERQFFYAKN